MTVEVADPTKGVAAYLKAQIGTMVGNRVWRPELPAPGDPDTPTNPNNPEAAIVVRPEAGYDFLAGSNLPVVTPAIEVCCYGSTRLETQEIARAVIHAMRELLPSVWDGVYLKWARVSSGVIPEIDQNTNWDYARVIFQVMCAELVVE